MVAYSSILPPSSLGQLLRPISTLSDEQFGAILSSVSGARSFSLKKDDIESLRNKLPPEAATNITFLISALAFVYSHVARLIESQMEFGEAISGVVNELEGEAQWPNKAKAAERLSALLDPKIHERTHKIQRLQTGFLPNAVGFSTMVDLRPDFGTGPEPQLGGYIPVIQFRVSTDAANPEERRIVFQVNEDSLAELKKALKRLDEKLSILRDKPALELLKR